MPEYVLYCFAGNKLERCDRFGAGDDAEAIEEAVRRHDGKAAELWTGTRKVDTFEASDACGAGVGAPGPARLHALKLLQQVAEQGAGLSLVRSGIGSQQSGEDHRIG
jgi:hypothetical protein